MSALDASFWERAKLANLTAGAIDRMKLATIRTERRFVTIVIVHGPPDNKRYLLLAVGTSILDCRHRTASFSERIAMRELALSVGPRVSKADGYSSIMIEGGAEYWRSANTTDGWCSCRRYS